jgi:hypothetical protein
MHWFVVVILVTTVILIIVITIANVIVDLERVVYPRTIIIFIHKGDEVM